MQTKVINRFAIYVPPKKAADASSKTTLNEFMAEIELKALLIHIKQHDKTVSAQEKLQVYKAVLCGF